MEDFPSIVPLDENELPSIDCNFNSATISDEHLRQYRVGSFSMLVMNIRSIRCNFPSFEIFLDSLQHPFDIIVLTETWLSSSIDCGFDLAGYDSITLHRSNHGGGIKLYHRTNMSVASIPQLTFISECMELLSVEVSHGSMNFKQL